MKPTRRLLTIVLMCLFAAGCAKAKESAPQHTPAATTTSKPAGGEAKTEAADQSRGGLVDGRKLKRTAYLTIEVDDEERIPEVVDKARQKALDFDGYVASESTDSIEVMVPTERLDQVLAELDGTGEVVSKRVSVEDVTSQYVDLKVRIDNLEKTRQRLKQLMSRAQNVEETLKVEKELTRVTTELEQLKGQMRRMKRETTYARLHVHVEKDVRPGPIGWVFYGLYRGVKWLFIWD